MTPQNSYAPSESSRCEEFFCASPEDEDVIMQEIQPQAMRNPSPSKQELDRWYRKGGHSYLSFTK